MGKLTDTDHAMRTGLLAGTLMQAGIRLVVEADDEGYFTDKLTIFLPGPDFEEVTIHVQVLNEVV